MQHFRTFSERLANFPVKIDYVSRFKSEKQIKEILQNTKAGSINILIGTHRIVSKDVEFKNLGLLIIDEEQKFGVKVKDRLKRAACKRGCPYTYRNADSQNPAFFFDGRPRPEHHRNGTT